MPALVARVSDSIFPESFRGALLREPGIHNPDAFRIIPTCGYGFRLAGKSPHPGMTTLD